jgi:hypothetical protein
MRPASGVQEITGPPNQSLNLTGAAFLFRAVQRLCSGPGKLAQEFMPRSNPRMALA